LSKLLAAAHDLMSLHFRRSRPPLLTPRTWVRIDKSTASAQPIDQGTVLRAAQGFFADPPAMLVLGRFHTPFAIYSRAECLEATDPRPGAHGDH
jgi:hypothetical protein